jgi:hypothetical protein
MTAVYVASYAFDADYGAECDDPSTSEGGLEMFATPQLTHVLSSMDSVGVVLDTCKSEWERRIAEDNVYCEEEDRIPVECEWSPMDSHHESTSVEWHTCNLLDRNKVVVATVVIRRMEVQ